MIIFNKKLFKNLDTFSLENFLIYDEFLFLIYDEFLPVLIFLTVAIILALLIVLLSYFLSIQNPDTEKLSSYECVFEPSEDVSHLAADIFPGVNHMPLTSSVGQNNSNQVNVSSVVIEDRTNTLVTLIATTNRVVDRFNGYTIRANTCFWVNNDQYNPFNYDHYDLYANRLLNERPVVRLRAFQHNPATIRRPWLLSGQLINGRFNINAHYNENYTISINYLPAFPYRDGWFDAFVTITRVR